MTIQFRQGMYNYVIDIQCTLLTKLMCHDFILALSYLVYWLTGYLYIYVFCFSFDGI